jgi:hypothetical protein
MSLHYNGGLDPNVDLAHVSSSFSHQPEPGTPAFALLSTHGPRCRQGWRLRKCTLFIFASIVLILSSLFVLNGFANLKRAQPWDHSDPQPFVQSDTQFKGTTATTTITAPAITETITVYQTAIPKLDPVVFFLIIWSETSAIEGAVLIKVRVAVCFWFIPEFIFFSQYCFTTPGHPKSILYATILLNSFWKRGYLSSRDLFTT